MLYINSKNNCALADRLKPETEREGLERKAHRSASSRSEDLKRKARPRHFLSGARPKEKNPSSKIQAPNSKDCTLRITNGRITNMGAGFNFGVLVFGFWSLVFGIWSLVFSKGGDWFIYQKKKNAVSIRQIIYLCKLKIIYESLKM